MSTAYTRRAIIVVTASDRDQANQDALAFDPIGGAEMFRVGLSADGSTPATHYWASTVCREAVWQALVDAEAAQVAKGAGRTRRLFDGLTVTPDDVLAALGLQRLVVSD